jgi:hypothetical protein
LLTRTDNCARGLEEDEGFGRHFMTHLTDVSLVVHPHANDLARLDRRNDPDLLKRIFRFSGNQPVEGWRIKTNDPLTLDEAPERFIAMIIATDTVIVRWWLETKDAHNYSIQ